ncbi:HtaA domain-containing protein [Microbacterium foliorum]
MTENSAPLDITGLVWGVKASFRRYIQTLKDGAVHAAGGAALTGDGEAYFPIAPDAPVKRLAHIGEVQFQGKVTFTGHEGMMQLVIARPAILLRPARTLLIIDDAAESARQDGRVALLELQPTRPVVHVAVGEWIEIPATLTAEGAQLFNGTYSAGQSLDPLHIRLR